VRAILTFHSIDDSGSVLSYPVGAFAQLMTSIAESGIPVLELDQLWSSTSGVVITFDDGMQSLRDSALPVLRDLGLPAHLFLTTGVVGGDNYWPTQPASAPRMQMLTWDDIEHCQQAGMRVESHTHMHPDLRSLSSSQIEAECEAADREIVAHTGRAPKHFAYPYGYFDDSVAQAVRGRYKFAVTTQMAFLEDEGHDAAKLPRLDTYYFKDQLVRSNPFGRVSRSYLTARRILRSIRESLQ
jgi:peptidoglycan/xylan/chitin deacetylase (PgdA/CDA1 family)